MFSFQLSHNQLDIRPYSIITDENGTVQGVWSKKIQKDNWFQL